MTIGINPSTMQLRIPVGAPYHLHLRMSDGASGYQDLAGRNFALAFYSGTASPFRVEADLGADTIGAFAAFSVTGAASMVLQDVRSLSWEVAELFSDGKIPLATGELFIAPAAVDAAAIDPDQLSSGFDQIEWSPAGQVVLGLPVGSRGLSAAEQLYPGVIDAPTAEAFQALIRSLQAQIADLKIGPRLDFSDPSYGGFLVALGLCTLEAS